MTTRHELDLDQLHAFAAPEHMFAPLLAEASITVPLVSGLGAAGDGRTVCRTVLEQWKITGDTVDDAALVVSELVANGAVHGLPPVWLQLARTTTDVVVAVYDRGPLTTRLLQAADAVFSGRADPLSLAEGGRGLAVVHGLARHAEILASINGGKVVRAVLPRP